jgi:hypothetical protein
LVLRRGGGDGVDLRGLVREEAALVGEGRSAHATGETRRNGARADPDVGLRVRLRLKVHDVALARKPLSLSAGRSEDVSGCVTHEVVPSSLPRAVRWESICGETRLALSAKKRSGCDSAVAFTIWPPGRTTVMDTTLSKPSPCWFVFHE